MDYRKYGSQVVIRLDEGDEMIASVTEVCRQTGIYSGSIHGIGATKKMTVRVADLDTGNFFFKDLTDSMEITSLDGNITMTDDGIYVHLHVNAADKDMNIRGGHMISCVISVTSELYLQTLDGVVRRDPPGQSVLGRLNFDK